MSIYKKLLIAMGIAGFISQNILLYFTFLTAYFNSEYRVTILINKYNEAHVEFVLIPIFFVLGVWAVHQLLKTSFNKKRC